EGYFLQAKETYFAKKDHSGFLKCVQKLLRIYAETGRSNEIQDLKNTLQSLVVKDKLKLDSRTYFTLGLCASFEGNNELALDYEEKSLALALAADNKEDICYAIHGIAIIYAAM